MQPFAAADLPLVPDSSLPPPAAARAAPAAARSTVHADHRPKAGAAPPVTEPGVATRSGFSQTRVRAQGGAPTPAAPPASSPLAATSAMPAPARRRGRRRPAADPGMATPAKLSACAAAPTTRKRARAERAAVVSPVPLPPPLAGEGKRRGVGGAGRDGPVSIVFSAAAALQQVREWSRARAVAAISTLTPPAHPVQADRRRFCKAFGYRDAGDDDMEALDARTVLVMDASQRALREGGTALLATKRTLKYLLARARGMPIVASTCACVAPALPAIPVSCAVCFRAALTHAHGSPSFPHTGVSSSLCADALLPQEDFAVGGDAKCPPPAAPAVAAARAKPPLDGWSVAFCGRFGDGTPSVGKVLVPVAQGLGANVRWPPPPVLLSPSHSIVDPVMPAGPARHRVEGQRRRRSTAHRRQRAAPICPGPRRPRGQCVPRQGCPPLRSLL